MYAAPAATHHLAGQYPGQCQYPAGAGAAAAYMTAQHPPSTWPAPVCASGAPNHFTGQNLQTLAEEESKLIAIILAAGISGRKAVKVMAVAKLQSLWQQIASESHRSTAPAAAHHLAGQYPGQCQYPAAAVAGAGAGAGAAAAYMTAQHRPSTWPARGQSWAAHWPQPLRTAALPQYAAAAALVTAPCAYPQQAAAANGLDCWYQTSCQGYAMPYPE